MKGKSKFTMSKQTTSQQRSVLSGRLSDPPGNVYQSICSDHENGMSAE